MPLPKHRSPFARRLLLSEAESDELSQRARTLVADAVDGLEQFLWRQHGAVSATEWTLDRDKDDVRVYHARREGTRAHELLAVGALHGDLDDALFGALATTTEALRLRAAYTKTRLSNGAVLAIVERPTHAEPFRTLSVQWVVSGEPLHVRALTVGKKSDVVVLDATGTRALSNGETVGFHLVHSVELADAPPLPKYDRATISLCALWRQSADDRVQLYARATVSASDKSHATRATRALGGSLLGLARVVHCAQMKKLAWLMRCKASQLGGRRPPPFRSLTGPVADDLRSSTSSMSSNDRGCEVCPSQMGARRHAKASCIVCARLVCSDCRVKRELCAIALDGRLAEQRVAFCLPCHTIATRVAAADVASEDATRAVSSREPDHTIAVSHTSSVVHVPGVASDDENNTNSPQRGRGVRRGAGFGHDEQDDDDGSDDNIADVDRVFLPRKSLQTSSAAGTLEADDDELESARRARGASGLAPSYMYSGH